MLASPNDVVPAKADTNEKSESESFRIFGWDGWVRTIEMPESKSGALPLGYIPLHFDILPHMPWLVNNKKSIINNNFPLFYNYYSI